METYYNCGHCRQLERGAALEKEWLAAGKKAREFHVIFYTELVGIWLMICGETTYFNLDRENKCQLCFMEQLHSHSVHWFMQWDFIWQLTLIMIPVNVF